MPLANWREPYGLAILTLRTWHPAAQAKLQAGIPAPARPTSLDKCAGRHRRLMLLQPLPAFVAPFSLCRTIQVAQTSRITTFSTIFLGILVVYTRSCTVLDITLAETTTRPSVKSRVMIR